ncbi:MAG: EamA family transporter [Gammaproteobacteria bacterium]
MAIVLGILAALAYGSSDFVAGLGSRRLGTGPVTLLVLFLGIVVAAIAVGLFPGSGPSPHALIWGAISGVGSASGSLLLYRGFAIGEMSVVSPLCAVFTAVVPVIVGVSLGNHLSAVAAAGVAIAVPAAALTAFKRKTGEVKHARRGILEAVLSGVGFALLFIALDRAGTASGAWPLLPGQAVAFLLVLPFGWKVVRNLRGWTRSTTIIVVAGVLSGVANLLFLAATGSGQLAVVAVLTSLYPAVTILFARVVLGERWNALQMTGLAAVAAAIVLISLG